MHKNINTSSVIKSIRNNSEISRRKDGLNRVNTLARILRGRQSARKAQRLLWAPQGPCPPPPPPHSAVWEQCDFALIHSETLPLCIPTSFQHLPSLPRSNSNTIFTAQLRCSQIQLSLTNGTETGTSFLLLFLLKETQFSVMAPDPV